ncbi:MAG: hypothetical protein JWN60_1104 [Acidobacteria bacterium]|jgi:hypothetical protein|nr:hypothetical protein [Acidobacteriota bacterium]
MKKLFSSAILALFLIQSIFAQEKPLAQAEYVKMLYALQKNPVEKQELIESVRRRGIGFVLTDGLRGLTRSKSGNDEELKRALEEAERRRQNPTEAKLPSAKEVGDILEKTRTNTLAAVEEMPDFVVKQQIQRSAAYAGTNNFRNLDKLIVAVSYRSSGQEDYRVLSLNGVIQENSKSKQSYEEVGGTSSTGEFVTVLAMIFKPESETKFNIIDTDTIRGRRAVVFDYSTTREKAKQRVTASGYLTDSAITGMKGKIWIDRETSRVLRVESEATELPENFPIRSAKRVIDYDWVTISEEKYLLPALSDVRLTFRESTKIFESRNLIRFKDYQKFGTEVIILDDDNAPIQEDKP